MKIKEMEMTKENIAKPDFLMISEMYREICKKSGGSQQGLTIKEIKKNYHLKQRDIEVLVRALRSMKAVYQILTPNESEEMDEDWENRETEAVKSDEENEDYKKLKDDNYIWINDTVDIIREKISESDLDIKNTTLMTELHRRFLNSETSIWSKRGDRSLKTAAYMIDRLGDKADFSARSREMRRNMVQAIVMKKKLQFSDGNGLKVVSPKGIYYNKALETYHLICREKDGEYVEYAVEKARFAKVLSDKSQIDSDDFNIQEYLRKTRIQCVTVRVYYHEGNVLRKFSELFSDHQCQEIERNQEYCIMTFMVDRYEPYEDVLDGYGQSVIVIGPEGLRNDMIRRAQNVGQIWNC